MDYLRDTFELTRDVIRPAHPKWLLEDLPDLTGKVYLVTGASSGIGRETARLLLARGAKLYITGRTPAKIEAAISEFREDFPNAVVELLGIHNEDLTTIAPAVAEFLSKETQLNGIVHNAGINYRGQNIVDSTGYLDIITINVLAPFLLQRLLTPIMEKTKDSRAVWVSSAIHYYAPPGGGIDWDSPNEWDAGSFLGKGNGQYGQTKAMNIYEAIQWAKRSPKVLHAASHPGAVYSDIRRENKWRKFVMELWCQPSQYGAYAEIWPLLNPAAETGKYYVPFGILGRVRPDIQEAADGPRGTKFWNWAIETTDKFMPSPSRVAN